LAYFESDFWHPSVATDAVILSLRNGRLSVVLGKRSDGKGWALPGGFIQEGESLDDCVKRELKEETGIEVPFLTQFKNYSDPQRDDRHQTISVAYLAVHPSGKLRLKADTDVTDVGWFDVDELPTLAFDHNQICSDAVIFAKGLVEQKPELVFAFHEGDFTLTELQQTYAALAGEKYAPENKRNFRLWVSNFGDGAGLVEETGEMKTGSHRPAKLYRPNSKLFRR